ncbi:hypothetical protein ABE193_26320 [Bacillus mycoides]
MKNHKKPIPHQSDQPQVLEQQKVSPPVIPQLEKPQLKQTPKKVESKLLKTAGKDENPYIKWSGHICNILDLIRAVYAVRNRKKVQ